MDGTRLSKRKDHKEGLELGSQDGGVDRYEDLILIASNAGWRVRKAGLSLVALRDPPICPWDLPKADRSAIGSSPVSPLAVLRK